MSDFNIFFSSKRIPSRESEAQHRTRMAAAKRQRDAYESRARYLAHVQAMAPLVNLPPVSVPSELFQCALARAGIKMVCFKVVILFFEKL